MTAKYASHNNSLTLEDGREVPCHDSCKELFKDGQRYQEEKDYRIYNYQDRLVMAYPLTPAEDELWRELFNMINGGATIDDVEKLYIIQKR